MLRILTIAAVLAFGVILAPVASAAPLEQRHGHGHHGTAVEIVVPGVGATWGTVGRGSRFINGCFRYCGPAVLGVPFIPPPPIVVPVPVGVGIPVAVAAPVLVPALPPVAFAPPLPPALPGANPCGCPQP